MNPSEFGLIIADRNGTIIEHNEMAELILQESKLAGKPVKLFLSSLDSLTFQKTVIGDKIAYLMTSANSRLLENILEINSSAFAICNPKGRITYCNSPFSSFFNRDFGENSSGVCVDELFQNYCKEWVGLKLIKKAKKEVSFKIVIDGQNVIVLFRPVYGNHDQISCILISCSYSKEMSLLKKEVSELQKEIAAFKAESSHSDSHDKPKIIMNSRQMAEINTLIQNLAPKDITMLLLGKSGTGKSFLAKTIHMQSMRRSKQFVTINCSAIPDSLIESELFGYEKGAFTGALSSGKKGLVEIANGGTLFLDEIADMPFNMQSKLLQLIQEKTFTPVGGISMKKADIRIIAATNKDLQEAIKNGTFREDLYYRIAVAVINIPPLSDRKEDSESIIDEFLDYFNRKHNKKIIFTRKAKNHLVHYSWPGNIREIEHLLEFLVLCNNHDIDASDLPYHILRETDSPDDFLENRSAADDSRGAHLLNFERITSFDKAVEEYKRQLVRHFYQINKSSYKLAKGLSVSQTKANHLIQKYINSKATE